MKSNLAWHSELFTSDLPTAKILLQTWRGFGSFGWAASAQLKLFCLRKLINDCCHERWRRGKLGSSARCWGRQVKPFRRGHLHYFTLLEEKILGLIQKWIRVSWDFIWLFTSGVESFFLSVSLAKLWAPLFWVLRMAPLGLAVQVNGVGMNTQLKKEGAFEEHLWSVQPRRDCQDRYWQIGKSNS